MKRIFCLEKLFLVLIIPFSGCIGTDVVQIELVPERIVITESPSEIKVGDTFAFEARFFNNMGELVAADIEWQSSNPGILAMDAEGLATAISAGAVEVTASANNASDQVAVTVGQETIVAPTSRAGTFRGLNNYVVDGEFTLSGPAESLLLEFSESFMATNGPGLFIYLTSSESSVTGGVELGPIKNLQGAQSYEVPAEIGLQQYDFVLVYCKPFGVPFGLGEFEN